MSKGRKNKNKFQHVKLGAQLSSYTFQKTCFASAAAFTDPTLKSPTGKFNKILQTCKMLKSYFNNSKNIEF